MPLISHSHGNTVAGILLLCLGILLPIPVPAQCTDCDGDGVARPADCNDLDAGVFPGATETCNGVDDDCDGLVDEEPACATACGPISDLSPDRQVSPDGEISWQPSFASTGSGYALAWSDLRDGSAFQVLVDFADGLGRPRGAPIQVTTLSTSAVQPSLAWTGSGFALAYARGGDLLFQRLDYAGATVGLPVTVATGAGLLHANPHLIWTGQAFALVAERIDTGAYAVVFAALDPGGSIVIPATPLAAGADPLRRPRIASDGVGYGVVWEREDAGTGALSADFVALDAAGVVTAGPAGVSGNTADSRDPDIVWNGSLFAVAWRDQRDGNAEIYFNRLDAAGAAQGSDVRVTDAAGVSNEPRITWTGARHALVWRDRRDGNGEIYFTLLDAAGVEDGDDRRLTADGANSYEPIPVFTGSTVGVAWVDDRNGPDEIRLLQVGCGCADGDGDGVSDCHDCDDGEPDIYPGAPQICDGLNNDCDDPAWPDQTGDDVDADGDDVTICQGDCDDTAPTVYPEAPELCDGLNNDCSDPDWPTVPPQEFDGDGDTYLECAECDDTDLAIYPGAPEICDGLNNDCNDPDWPALPASELDSDGDTFVECAECDDTEAAVYPGAPQICDGLNNDCDHPSWPALTGTSEVDQDGDGLAGCDGDCEPLDGTVYPGAPEICDGQSNDCLATGWPALPPSEQDLDDDGFRQCEECDDTAPEIYPGALQICDGVNNNCDHPGWPGLAGTGEIDDDGDGFSACDGDCSAFDPGAYPGAPEVCDGRDQDCDGSIDVGAADCMLSCLPPDLIPSAFNIIEREGDFTWFSTGSDRRDGPGHAVAWFEGFFDYYEQVYLDEIRFALLDGDGQPDGAPTWVTQDAEIYGGKILDLDFTGDGYGLLWSGDGRIHFARLDASGAPLAQTLISDGLDGWMAWSGHEFGIAWEAGSSTGHEIRFRRLDASGSPVGDELLVGSASGRSEQQRVSLVDEPAIVWADNSYMIAWAAGTPDVDDHIAFVRLEGSTGLPMTPVKALTTSGMEAWQVLMAPMEGELGLIVGPESLSGGGFRYLRTSYDGDILSDQPLAFRNEGGSDQLVRGLWTGQQWLLTVRETRPGAADLVGLDSAGNLLWIRPETIESTLDGLSWPSQGRLLALYGHYSLGLSAQSIPCDCTDPATCCTNQDGDPFTSCDGDCDDTRAAVFPGAGAQCDGLNNNCDDPDWPSVEAQESDLDGDGVIECADTCPGTPNPSQDPAEPCPGCLAFSGGGVIRGDQDGDGLPDACDPDDGFQWLGFQPGGDVQWHLEPAWQRFNLYRGSLGVLKADYVYTQQPGSNSLADRSCNLTVDTTVDTPSLQAGEVAFYLLTGEGPDPESGLGSALWPLCDCYSCGAFGSQPLCNVPPAWLGTPEARENANPCP